jgi:hypothetical protein
MKYVKSMIYIPFRAVTYLSIPPRPENASQIRLFEYSNNDMHTFPEHGIKNKPELRSISSVRTSSVQALVAALND